MTLRWRMTLVIAMLVTLTSVILTAVFQREIMEDHKRDHVNWAATLSDALAKAILRDTLTGSKIDVQNTLKRVQKSNEDLVYLVEVGFNGQAFASTLDNELPPELANIDHRQCRAGTTRTIQFGGKAVHDVTYPVIDKLGAHLHLGLNDDSFTRSVDMAIEKTIMAAALILVGALAIAIIVSRRISLPLTRLATAVAGFGQGEPFVKEAIPSGDREVRQLVTNFDQMVRQRIEAEQGQKRLAAILEATTDFVGMADLTGRITYLNHAGRAMVGLGSNEELNHQIANFHPQWATELIVGTGIPAAAASGVWEGESAVLRPDKSEIPVSQVILAHYDTAGQIEFFSTIVRDITERKKAERELLLIRHSFEHAAELLLRIDADGRLTDVNATTCKTLGYSREELLAMHIYEFVNGLTKEMWVEHWNDVRERQSFTVEREFRTRDGRTIPVEAEVNYLEYDGEPFYFKAARDITERKRAEAELLRLNADLERRVEERTAELIESNDQLKGTLATLERTQDELVRSEKLASLGSLVAGVAHELNTPLGNSLTLATSLADRTRQFNGEFTGGNLRRSSLSEFIEFTEKACAILTSSLFTASELISHFKQVAVDQTSEQRRPFELAEVIKEVTMTLNPQFKKSPHKLEIDIPDGIGMDSYPGPLGQVVTNLVNNGLIHGLDGDPGGTIRIEAHQSGEEVEITVSDNGKGISPENLPRIFDPFFTTRLGQGGSGLGLHIVYSIVVRLLGGRISANSEVGKGTCFTLKLPLIAQEQADVDAGKTMSVSKNREIA